MRARGIWREKSQIKAIAEEIVSIIDRCFLRFVCLTQILHILVGDQGERASLTLPALSTRAVAFEDDDAIGGSGGDESSAVAELCPTAVVAEGDVAQGVAERAQEQSNMADEPCELQGLGERNEALLERAALGRRRSHWGWWLSVTRGRVRRLAASRRGRSLERVKTCATWSEQLCEGGSRWQR